MKPQDLTLKQLEAIPLKEYDTGGESIIGDSSICRHKSMAKITCSGNLYWHNCILATPALVKARIKELESQKQ